MAERVHSPSASYDPTSSTPRKPHPVSPSSVSSPNPSSLHQPIPSSSGIGGGEVITPGASPLPSTPSPRTSQLEAVQRNADSGFVSEAAEDPASPLPAAAEVWDEARVRRPPCVSEGKGKTTHYIHLGQLFFQRLFAKGKRKKSCPG